MGSHRMVVKNTTTSRHYRPKCTWWTCISYSVTFWALPPFLWWIGGMKDKSSQQAFREKVTLCMVIFTLCAAVAFLTFFLPKLLCPSPDDSRTNRIIKFKDLMGAGSWVWAYGNAYQSSQVTLYFTNLNIPKNGDISSIFPVKGICGTEKSLFYKNDLENAFFNSSIKVEFDWDDLNLGAFQASVSDKIFPNHANFDVDHILASTEETWNNPSIEPIFSVFSQSNSYPHLGKLIVINGVVINATLIPDLDFSLQPGQDASLSFANKKIPINANCLLQKYKVGIISKEGPGCFFAKAFFYTSLFIIVFVILLRFLMAVVFDWCLAPSFAKSAQNSSYQREKRSANRLATMTVPGSNESKLNLSKPSLSFPASLERGDGNSLRTKHGSVNSNNMTSQCRERIRWLIQSNIGNKSIPSTHLAPSDSMYVFLLVTCYSEGKDAIIKTLDSLVNLEYDPEKRLLVVISDGIVTGSGNSASTPDIILSLMDPDPISLNRREGESFIPLTYDSIGEYEHAINAALLYAGYYRSSTEITRILPMILIVKTGHSSSELSTAVKPGNRGKRDSQIILIHFLMRILFDDRMTELDFVFFNAVFTLMGVTADVFEAVMMVDADTCVDQFALVHLIHALQSDHMTMGVCGETRITNKRESWVTMIQVFEYYISHHLGKGFESVFGGVTCLPGCFCLYRIKAPKNGGWVPLLCSPEVASSYGDHSTATLHKKNLLLLGEDRYLSTLLLQHFPRRKLMFVPRAICHTMVPSSFAVLLSQRRRWINSTIHNLFELLFVRDLCGIFCCSMQFVVFMELVGTLVLPAAITFTVVLIIVAISNPTVAAVPLALLALILGLPAVLILITTRKFVYIGWMLIYLLALPIWNFILPLYAYWHFDDFSWGATRPLESKGTSNHMAASTAHSPTSPPGVSPVPMHRWCQWVSLGCN